MHNKPHNHQQPVSSQQQNNQNPARLPVPVLDWQWIWQAHKTQTLSHPNHRNPQGRPVNTLMALTLEEIGRPVVWRRSTCIRRSAGRGCFTRARSTMPQMGSTSPPMSTSSLTRQAPLAPPPLSGLSPATVYRCCHCALASVVSTLRYLHAAGASHISRAPKAC